MNWCDTKLGEVLIFKNGKNDLPKMVRFRYMEEMGYLDSQIRQIMKIVLL